MLKPQLAPHSLVMIETTLSQFAAILDTLDPTESARVWSLIDGPDKDRYPGDSVGLALVFVNNTDAVI